MAFSPASDTLAIFVISGAPAAVLAVICPCLAIGGGGGKGRREEEEDMEEGRHGEEEIQVG